MKSYPNLISAEIIADSKAPTGERITTFKLVMPRYILAEFNTHRLFSRNSASSRAIPFKKLLKQVEETPFVPMAWQKDHKGMQGSEYFTIEEANESYNTNQWIEGYTASELHERNWLQARNEATNMAEILNEGGVTKQLCNRLLEPFLYHTVLVTATQFSNFFELRCPKYPAVTQDETIYYKSFKDLCKETGELQEDWSTLERLQGNKGQGEIHIMDLAEKMWDAMNESTPKELKEGEWHLPMGENITNTDEWIEFCNKIRPETKETDRWEDVEDLAIKVATARCARISYETLGDNPKIDYEADIKLHDMLLASKHASPFEHVCMVPTKEEYDKAFKGEESGWFYNLKGFKSYRFSLGEEEKVKPLIILNGNIKNNYK